MSECSTANDVVLMVLRSIAPKPSILNKGSSESKAAACAIFDCAHLYASKRFKHSGGDCCCLKCLGCQCAECSSADVEEKESEEEETEMEKEDTTETDAKEKTECDICGKSVKDLDRHMRRLHSDVDDEQETEHKDEERELLRAQLEAAEKAEKEAKELAMRAQKEKEDTEAKFAAEQAKLAAERLPTPAQAEAAKQVKTIGASILSDMRSGVTSRPFDNPAQQLQTLLSFVPGRLPTASISIADAVSLYKSQFLFGRRIDLHTRFAAGRLARQFYAYDGGPLSSAQATAARQGLSFEKFCATELGVDDNVVRAEIRFSLLCDLAPAFLPALSRCSLFSWTDFVYKSSAYFDAWQQWLEENGFIEKEEEEEPALLTCPLCGATMQQQSTLDRHLGPNPPQSCLSKRNKNGSGSGSGAPVSLSLSLTPAASSPATKRKPNDDEEEPGPEKKQRLESVFTTTHLQTIRRYDPPLIGIADVLESAAFRSKQLCAVRFDESELNTAIEQKRPYLATDPPVTYRGSSSPLPSASQLLDDLRKTLGRTIEKVDWHEGKTRQQSFYVKAVFDSWQASGSQYLPADQLVNIVNGRADKFAKRFVFGGGLDASNALGMDKQLRAITLSPRGAFTNTHYDDYTGVTLYLSGLKFWMFMDEKEVKERSESIPDMGAAEAKRKPMESFSLQDFCAMHNSWWTLTQPGQLLVVPEYLFHRVVTLEPTFGVTFNFERSAEE